MNIELITKEIATQKWQEVKEEAHVFSDSYQKPIAEINEKVCVDFMNYAALTQLQKDEVCVFINGQPAKWQTTQMVEGGGLVIGKLCFKNVHKVFMRNNILCVKFKDGLVEQYRQKNELWHPIQSQNLSN